VCQATFGGTFYVATTGSDGGAGSSAFPWATLQHAVDTVGPGDVIVVRAGTYVGCRIGNSGLSTAPITLKADAGAQVILNAPGPANKHNSIVEVENFSATVSYWVIDGFEVENSPKYGIDVRVTTHITVQNCKAHNSALTGIFDAFSDYPVIQHNISYSNGEHGIYHSNSGDYPTIRANQIHNNVSAGVHMNGDISQGGDGQISFALVEKNVIWENGTGGGSGINCDGVDDSIFRNNLLYSNHASGISLYAIDAAHGSSRNQVLNNTIVMATGARWAVNIPKSPSGKANPVGNIVENNILYSPTSPRGSILTYAANAVKSDYNVVVNRFSINGGTTDLTLTQWRVKTGQDTHSFLSTPTALFVDPVNNNYQLKAGSPAADAGATLTQVTDDITGKPRPLGGYDIGAYETF
jgi:parallel beta-helix repeat protein